MSIETWVYILAVIINAATLFSQVFHIILYTDLECDFTNPTDLCFKLNMVELPEMAAQAFLSFLFLICGYFFSFFISLPLLIFHMRKIYFQNYQYDPTDIFRLLSSKKVESFAKLLFYLLSFFLSLYFMITSLIHD